MCKRRFFCAAAVLVLFAVLAPGAVRAGPITYHVSVDTSSINGQSGFLDLQFNPGGNTAKLATATVTNFTPAGNLQPLDPNNVQGDVTGSLPGPLALTNDTFNDYFQGFTFGTSIAFDLTLSGPALDSPGGNFGSSFALSLYDSTGTLPLLTNAVNGSVLTTNLNANGTTTAIPSPNAGGGPPVAAATPATSAVPEPSSLLLLSMGSLSLLGYGFSRKRRHP